jgi:hypothetical protein
MPNGLPQPQQVDMSVIQEAIDRRRQGGVSPQIEQQTGAAAPPVTGEAPPVGPAEVMAQRAGAAPAPEAAPAGAEETPEETRLVMQMLVERLQKLLRKGAA